MSRVIHDQFDAMGTTVEVVIVGEAIELVDEARRRVQHLEQRWSRFLPDSDVSMINRAEGAPVMVHHDTVTLLRAMRAAVAATGGAFDPTVLSPGPRGPVGFESLPFDDAGPSVIVPPPGLSLDPGGIGKGLAADLVVAELLRRGASGALVSVGGDLRVAGEAPQDGGWIVDVAHPHFDHTITGRVVLADGGVATSGTQRRRLVGRDGREGHHLLQPATGTPIGDGGPADLVEVTVVAGTAAWAEVWTKYVFVNGVGAGLRRLDELGLPARAVLDRGDVVTNDAWGTVAAPLTSIGGRS